MKKGTIKLIHTPMKSEFNRAGIKRFKICQEFSRAFPQRTNERRASEVDVRVGGDVLLRPCCCDLLTLIQITEGALHLASPAHHMLCSDRGGESHLEDTIVGIKLNQKNQAVTGCVTEPVGT